MDDLIDESIWVNVQDPVRQMITAITKAVRTQSAGIRDLDRKVNSLVTNDILDRSIAAEIAKMSSKVEVQDIVREMDARSNEMSSNFGNYENRLADISNKLVKMMDLVNTQSVGITNMNSRIERLAEDINELRVNPNYDPIYAYVDRQVQHVANDFARKLGTKIDQHVFDVTIPQQLKDTLTKLDREITNIKGDISKNIATKTDILELHANKANIDEVHGISAELSTKMTQFEVNQVLTNQLNPLVTAISAMEKIVQIQGEDELQARSSSGSHLLRSKDTPYSSAIPALTVDKVYHMIDEYVHQHRLGDVTPVRVDSALAQHTEHMLKETTALCEASRIELMVETKETIEKMLSREVKDRIKRLEQSNIESSELHKKSKQTMKQLASNVAKALATKTTNSELKEIIRKEVKLDLALDGRYVRHMNSSSSGGRSRSLDRGRERDRSVISPSTGITRGPLTESKTGGGGNISSGSNQSSSYHYHYYSDEENAPRNNSRYENRSARDYKGDTSSTLRRENDELRLEVHQLETTMNTLKNVTESLKSQVDSELLTIRNHLETRLSASEAIMRLEKTHAATAGINDWRIALGESNMNFRRELSDKMNRDEVISYVRGECEIIDKRVQGVTKELDNKATVVNVNQIESDILIIRNKIAGELTGGRWLWTTGQLARGLEGIHSSIQSGTGTGSGSSSAITSGGSWIPWDTEVVNAAPAILCWKRGVTSIKTRMAGLYRITVSIFTSMPCAIQLCLNGEPIITLQPDIGGGTTSKSSSISMTSAGGGGNNRSALVADERYVLKRNRHSIGEVTCISIDEYVSLPVDALLAVRYHSSTPAQGFLALKKV